MPLTVKKLNIHFDLHAPVITFLYFFKIASSGMLHSNKNKNMLCISNYTSSVSHLLKNNEDIFRKITF